MPSMQEKIKEYNSAVKSKPPGNADRREQDRGSRTTASSTSAISALRINITRSLIIPKPRHFKPGNRRIKQTGRYDSRSHGSGTRK